MKGKITLTRIEFGSDLIRFCNLGIGFDDLVKEVQGNIEEHFKK